MMLLLSSTIPHLSRYRVFLLIPVLSACFGLLHLGAPSARAATQGRVWCEAL